jgi:hypothetical protein
MANKHTPATWRAVIGTARGAAHDARGLPNQDSAQSLAIDHAGAIVVAVADGHGHDRHFRSAAGSKLAVAAACAVVEGLTAAAGEQPWRPERAAALRDRLPGAIVARWRESVALDIAAHPYTAAELAALEHLGDGPDIPYGSTLLVALIADGWLVCAQIGDGDLLAVQPDGGAWTPVSGDDLLDGYRTTSLCQPAAVSAFRTAAHDLRATSLLALLLSTDGYGNAQAEEPWQPVVARDIAQLAAQHDHGWFAGQLPAWAERCASAAGSADDTTIALLLAPGSERLAAAAQPASAAERTVGRSLLGEVTQPPRQPPPASPPATGSPGTFYRGADDPGAGLPAATDLPGSAAMPARFTRGRALTAGIAAAVAAAAIAAAVVMSQSSGSGPRPAVPPPAGQPAPRATSSSSGPVNAPAAAPASSRPGHPSNGGATHAKPTGAKPGGNQGG